MDYNMEKKGQSGVIMLESLIVIMVTVLLMFFTLALFSIMYQRYAIYTIADETAAKIAQSYEYGGFVDISTGVMGVPEYTGVDPYRYMFNQSPLLESAAEAKAAEYMDWRLKNTTYNILYDTKYTVDVKDVTMGRRYVTVTIEGGYKVPFGETLNFFGFGDRITYRVHGYADCVDLSNYINTVDYTNKWTKAVENNTFVKATTKVMKLFNNLLSKIP